MMVLHPMHIGLRYGIMMLYNVALSVSEEGTFLRSHAREYGALGHRTCGCTSSLLRVVCTNEVTSTAFHATLPYYNFHATLPCNHLCCYNEDIRFVEIHQA